MKNKILLTLAAATVLGAGLFTSRQVFAQETVQSAENPMTSLVQRIAQKFNLQESEVQAVFDQDRQERQAQHEATAEAQLTQLVTDGKITEAQKQLIIQKRNELHEKRQNEMDTRKAMTREERHSGMETERQALEDWAEQNNIDLQYLMMLNGEGKGPGMRGMKPQLQAGSSPTI